MIKRTLGALIFTSFSLPAAAELYIPAEAACSTLYAGQTKDAGLVCVDVVDDELFVSYTTHDGWQLGEVQLWVGDTLATLPTNKAGNPQIGLFPFKDSGLGGDSYIFSLPLSSVFGQAELCDVAFHYAAHAVVSKNGRSETGWSAGTRLVAKGNWATYSSSQFACRAEQPPVAPPTAYQCESAYALSDVKLGTNGNHGWLLGPIAPGTLTTSELIGGLHHDAGQVNVRYGLDGTVTVEFVADEPWTIGGPEKKGEAHVYVNNSSNPSLVPNGRGQWEGSASLADGQMASSLTVQLSGKSGDLYLAAHANVCKPE